MHMLQRGLEVGASYCLKVTLLSAVVSSKFPLCKAIFLRKIIYLQ